jgi:site-specific DNA-methyltransferase (adenine-specific)
MAPRLASHLVKLATTAGGTVLDPFGGSGNTAVAARALGRRSILIEISEGYALLAARRLAQQSLLA